MAIVKTETSMSSLIKMVEIQGKGRGFVASQPLKGGQIILQESPILTFSAFPLKHQEEQEDASTKYCSHCFRRFDSQGLLLSCPSCSHPNHTKFCSSKCQSLAFTSTHTPWVCHALSQLRHCSLLLDDQPEELQVQTRYLIAAYNLATSNPPAFETLLSLHGDGKKDMKTAMFLNSIISSLSLPFPEGISAPTVEMTSSLLEKESCNSFSLMEPFSEDGGRSTRAYGIYMNASFFNHDCLPNACRFDYLDSSTSTNDDGAKNTDIIIRTIHDVPQGKEICLSYFRVGLSYSERKKRLLDYFGFTCFCDRCKREIDDVDDDNDANFLARFMCKKANCGGTLAPWPSLDGNMLDVMECNFCGDLNRIN